MTPTFDDVVKIAPICVAFVAVFFGPLITLIIAKWQIKISAINAHKSTISPIRQKWIDSLRDLVASIAGRCNHYFVAGMDDVDEKEQIKLLEDIHKLELMINPNEEDHRKLYEIISKLHVSTIISPHPTEKEFSEINKKLARLTQDILKREWERVKLDGY